MGFWTDAGVLPKQKPPLGHRALISADLLKSRGLRAQDTHLPANGSAGDSRFRGMFLRLGTVNLKS